MEKFIKWFIFPAIFSMLCISIMVWQISKQDISVVKPFELKQKMTLRQLSIALEKQNIIKDADWFSRYIRYIRGDYSQFKAGHFRFQGSTSFADVADKFVDGSFYNPVSLQVTFPEGFNLKKIAARLERYNVGTQKTFLELTQDQSFIQELGIDSVNSLEGFLYPATYTFHGKLPSSKQVVRRMVEEFHRRVQHIDFAEKSISLYDAVKFASLIEKEASLENEKSFIAEVIWRRLKNREPIGIDAALIYGIPDYKGDIRFRHLKDRSNKYNTRIYKGLPPTPICSPSQSSLRAVVNPSNKGYYYYVVKTDGSAGHHFTRTLREHNQFVRQLVRASRSKSKK